MRQRNLDAGGNTFYSYKRTMLPFLFGIIARFALVLGIAFILGKTVPNLPANKIYRFVLLLGVCALLSFSFNDLNVWLLGFHKMSWTENSFLLCSLLPYSLFGHRNRTTQEFATENPESCAATREGATLHFTKPCPL
jgi:hypothetical protein